MPHSMSISDLEIRMEKILETKKTTVSLDTNIFKPPLLEKRVLELDLDLNRSKTKILNGYDIFDLFIKQRLYNKEIEKITRYISANNTAYLHLLGSLYEDYDNLILPIQVKDELEGWIRKGSMDEYEGWIEGENRPFETQAGNNLVYRNKLNTNFAPIFNAQYEYKKAILHFIKNIPKDQIVNYKGKEKFSKLIEQLNDAKAEESDKHIFADSCLSASDNKNKITKIISFDNGMPRIAKEFYRMKLDKKLQVIVHKGYSPKVMTGTQNIRVIKFDQAYHRSDKIAI